ncbi:Putative uncharacterized transposon-derived protein [Frankliniella fusca]|uniref:Uncharacterized transposon-derived protein n=1 Tax=Frankliniella fusca TaxID=407009 RepID=A0AAE1GVG7_9NEOP|nr:Putative uncharacterized transposon-derived protein [Frankliniella fusca]
MITQLKPEKRLLVTAPRQPRRIRRSAIELEPEYQPAFYDQLGRLLGKDSIVGDKLKSEKDQALRLSEIDSRQVGPTAAYSVYRVAQDKLLQHQAQQRVTPLTMDETRIGAASSSDPLTWREPDISKTDRESLNRLWTDVGHSFSAYAGKHLLREAALREGANVGAVAPYLSATRAYTRPKRSARKKIDQHFYSFSRLWSLVEIDLLTCLRISKQNSGFNYVLIAVEGASRKLFAVPLKTKTCQEVTKAFRFLLENRFPQRPETVRSDAGGEFTGGQFKNLLKQYHIRQLISANTSKSALAERAIQTLQRRLHRFMLHRNTYRFIDVLQPIVSSINNSPHASLGGLAPADVRRENLYGIWEDYYLTHYKGSAGRFKYRVNDPVRVSLVRQSGMDKGFRGTFSEEIYFVKERVLSNPRTYILQDILKRKIDGLFYEQELQYAPDFLDTEYKIDKVLARRRNRDTGASESLVTFEQWPKELQYWLKTSSVRKDPT